MLRRLIALPLALAITGVVAGFTVPFVSHWDISGVSLGTWGWLLLLYKAGSFGAVLTVGLAASVRKHALVWLSLLIILLDVAALIVLFIVAGNHGAFS